MTNEEAKNFAGKVFDLIGQANTIGDLEKIYDKLQFHPKNRMDINGYPKIEFGIDESDIHSLIETNILDGDLNFAVDVTSKLTDPLSKLLYSIAWKNGDLKKVKHIIKGVLDSKKEDSDQDQALVFYQFGKYLTKLDGQPIIDQHVIRAFAIYHQKEDVQVEKWRKLEIINKSHISIINEYKKWLISENLSQDLKEEKDYTYYIDQLLFATGKTIKFPKRRK